MDKFITVESSSKKRFLVNVSHIIRIDELSDSCMLRLSPASAEMNLSIKVKMSLEELLTLINN